MSRKTRILTLVGLVLAALVVIRIFSVSTRRFSAPSVSMAPTINRGDAFYADTDAYGDDEVPQRGDIVVFSSPHDPEAEGCSGEHRFVKRAIALPGDSIDIRRGTVFIDGVRQREPYLAAERDTSDFGPIDVPPGHVYVLGDNRLESSDSRVFGPVPLDLLCGKVVRIEPGGATSQGTAGAPSAR
ncbi:MAG TPA: signal peptidase I [Actinomycetota bacterium]